MSFRFDLAFGPTELDLLQSLWTHGPQTAREARAHINAARVQALHYNSVKTTLDRLAAKGVVDRLQAGSLVRHQHTYHYAPTLSRAELLSRIVSQAATDLGADRADVAAATQALVG